MHRLIDLIKKSPALVVFLVTFIIYSPLLLNHFVGDDHTIIETNTFYRSWHNIPRLFEKGYISNPKKIIFHSEPQSDFGTGSVSYRPVSNFTYFLDYYLFHAKAYGSHLIDILIHAFNAVLIYWIVREIFSSSMLGVFAALLFSLHPMQSEAVAVMSYRADVVATLFVLLSFCFWIKFKNNGYTNHWHYAASLAMFFLALFSKESAFMLPFVVLLFDQILVTSRPGIKQRVALYSGFIIILIFHLFLYFVVFPNATLFPHWLGGTFLNHCLIMGYIWYSYLINILLPWTVKIIPGLYYPAAFAAFSLKTIQIVLTLIILLTSIFVLWRKNKECVFFIFWYIIFYLPVSNLLPIANPMSCRFMYLPSIGLLIAVAFYLNQLFNSDLIKKYSTNLPVILHVAVILVCVTRTLLLNDVWKSDFSVAWEWIKDYPSYGRGYAILGKEYYNAGHFEKARICLEKSVLLGDTLPREVLSLAECYMQLGKFQEAKALLKQIITKNPDYPDPYFRLGVINYLQKDLPQAQLMLEKALMINPDEPLEYVYLMKVYIESHNFEATKLLLKKAALNLDAVNIITLEHILRNSKQ